MPAKDLFHKAVKHALEKESWLITDDPLHLEMGTFDYYIDLGAEEEIIAAEKEQRQIAIEVKSFIAPSTVNEFHTALGQFLTQISLRNQTAATGVIFSCAKRCLSILFSN